MLIARVVLAIEFNSIGIYVYACMFALLYRCVHVNCPLRSFQWLPFAPVVAVVFVIVRTLAARVDDVFRHAHVIKLAKENRESLRKSANTVFLAASSLRALIKLFLFDKQKAPTCYCCCCC